MTLPLIPVAQNSRFREIEAGVLVEMMSVRVEMRYAPAGVDTPEGLTATWWGREFLPIGDGYQVIGDGGRTLTTRLSDYATVVLDAGIDPVTGDPIRLSYLGATQWLKVAFDHQHNDQFPKPAEPEDPTAGDPPQ